MNISSINRQTKIGSNKSIQKKPYVNFNGHELSSKVINNNVLYAPRTVRNVFHDLKKYFDIGGAIERRKKQQEQKRINEYAWHQLAYYCSQDYRNKVYKACQNSDGNICQYAFLALKSILDDRDFITYPNYLTAGQEDCLIHLSCVFENAKDKNENHTPDNIKFLEYLIKSNHDSWDTIISIIRRSKDKNGNIDYKTVQQFYEWHYALRSHSYVGKFDDFMKIYNSCSDEGKKVLYALGQQNHGNFYDLNQIIEKTQGKDFEKIISTINAYYNAYPYQPSPFTYSPEDRSLSVLENVSQRKKENEDMSYEDFRKCLIARILNKFHSHVNETDEYYFEDFLKNNQIKNYADFMHIYNISSDEVRKNLISLKEKLRDDEMTINIAKMSQGNCFDYIRILKAINSDLDNYPQKTILDILQKSIAAENNDKDSLNQYANYENYKKIFDLLINDKELAEYTELLKDKDGIIRDENIEAFKDIRDCILDQNITDYYVNQGMSIEEAHLYAEELKDKNPEEFENVKNSLKDYDKVCFYVKRLKDENGIIQKDDYEIIKDIINYFKDSETAEHCITCSKDSKQVINPENIKFYKELYSLLKITTNSSSGKETVGKLLTIIKDKDSGVVNPESVEKLKNIIASYESPELLLYKHLLFCIQNLKNKNDEIQWDFVKVFFELINILENTIAKEEFYKSYTEILTLSSDSEGNIYKEINEILPDLIKKDLISDIPNILKISVHDNKFNKENYTKAINLIESRSDIDKHKLCESLLKCINDDGILDDKKINLLNSIIKAGYQNILNMVTNLNDKEINLLITLEKEGFQNIPQISAFLMNIPNDSDYKKALDLILYLRKDSDPSIEEDLIPIINACTDKTKALNDKSIDTVKKLKELKSNIKLSNILSLILNNKKEVDDNKLEVVTHFLKEVDIKNMPALTMIVDSIRINNNDKEEALFDMKTCDKLIKLYKKYGESDLHMILGYYNRDKNGNNNEILDALITYESPHEINYKFLRDFKENFLFQEYSKKNLYLPENFYEFLKSLKENDSFRSDNENVLYRPIENHESLFFMLPFIAGIKEKEEIFDKITKLLASLNCYEYDFNKKDTDKIPFIEKAIYSENPAMIDFINSVRKKDLIYYPDLDIALNIIKDDSFKAKLKELKFNYGEIGENWKTAAELRSTSALEKLLPQVQSLFFDKERLVLQAWNIAKNVQIGINSKQEFGKYLCDAFKNDISQKTMFKILEETIKDNDSSINNRHYRYGH